MIGNLTMNRFFLGQALLASILILTLAGCQNATSPTTSTTATATLTVTSPVTTKIYGITDSSTNTVAVPLVFTTNQAYVEYSLNSGTYTVATSGTNLASLLRNGFNTLDVRAKDSSGTVTKSADTLTLLHWNAVYSEIEGSSGYNANWNNATGVTTGVSSDTTASLYSGQSGTSGTFSLESGYLVLTTQTAQSTASGTNAYLAGTFTTAATPVRLAAFTMVRNLPYYSTSDTSWYNYVTVGQASSGTGGSMQASLGATASGSYQVALWDSAASSPQIATSSTVSISDFTPNSTYATSSPRTRYALGLIRDGTSFAAGLIDFDSVTVDTSGVPTTAPNIVALATKTGYTPTTTGLNSFVLAGRNLSSGTTKLGGLYLSWY